MLSHVEARVRPVASRIVVNVHHRPDDVRAIVGASVAVSEEVTLLGTAGGVSKARELLGDGPVLVWNGDIFADIDAETLVRAHAETADAVATLAIRTAPRGTGNVGLDADGRVVRMRKETVRDGEVEGGEFLGVHVLSEALRASLPAVGCLVGDGYLPALRRGARIGVHRHPRDGVFIDVGTLAMYLAANEAWRAAQATIIDGSWIAQTAHVDAAISVARVVVGEGARVVGSGAMTDVVVWPGAVARAPLARAIVTPNGVVAVPAV